MILMKSWIVLLTFLSVLKLGWLLSASFYGDSYLQLLLEDASSETDIRLEFRTYQSKGLLLLAAGSTDYCILELWSGSLRVRMDLGSGEAILHSPSGIRFDDLLWHKVQLTRSGADLQLHIDDTYSTSTSTPGHFHELNINRGLYVGGIGTLDDVFYGNFDDYRGCLRSVLFNSIDVFQGAQHASDPLNVYEVTWKCDIEFAATSDLPISFLTNTSFIAFQPLDTRSQGMVSFDIRTRSDSALLLYNSGHLSRSDFLSVELQNGRIKAVLNKGSGDFELTSEDSVNDGRWHQVQIAIEPMMMRVIVDGQRLEKSYRFSRNQFLDLAGHLFVGGISLRSRGGAVQKGIQSLTGSNAGGGSLEGCMQNIKVNGKLMGFREALITKGLQQDCVWTYPCTTNPCVDAAECLEVGYRGYECTCDLETCDKTPESQPEGGPLAPVHNIVAIQDVIVREGGQIVIGPNHIRILVEYASYNIRDSEIVFQVVKIPLNGVIYVDISHRNRRDIFTLHDIITEKVTYIHDGSEVDTDSIGLQLEFIGTAEQQVPNIFKQKYGVSLMIKVAPWNDKPVLSLPEDDTLVLVANTQIKITKKKKVPTATLR